MRDPFNPWLSGVGAECVTRSIRGYLGRSRVRDLLNPWLLGVGAECVTRSIGGYWELGQRAYPAQSVAIGSRGRVRDPLNPWLLG